MDLIYDIVGTIILVSIVATIILLPFIGIWRGIMIQKTWGQVEVIVTRHEFYFGWNVQGGSSVGNMLDGRLGGLLGGAGRARIHIKYTIEDSTYESFYYRGRSRHHILPPVGTREIRYYNPQKPNQTFSKEDCLSMIRKGIILGCILALFILFILS